MKNNHTQHKIHFPGLNTLRFIAAMAVFVFHVEMFKWQFDYKSLMHIPAFGKIGKLGVLFFFVLSGFLITYLLLIEKEKNNKIDVMKFYKRRIYRIWPLYYFLLIISLLLVFTNSSFFHLDGWLQKEEITPFVYLLYILFFPNVAVVWFKTMPHFGQSWSVGVEEQFYFIWPILLNAIKNVFKLLIGVILTYLLLKVALVPMLKYFFQYETSDLNALKEFVWDRFCIDCMAFGGLFAYSYYQKSKLNALFYNKYFQSATYLILFFSLFLGIKIPYFTNEYYAILFGIIILNVSTNSSSIVKLDNKIGDYLGKISYGIYMYNPLLIVVTLKSLQSFNAFNNFLLYLISFCLTVLVSILSYTYLEGYFLKQKNKHVIIDSGA